MIIYLINATFHDYDADACDHVSWRMTRHDADAEAARLQAAFVAFHAEMAQWERDNKAPTGPQTVEEWSQITKDFVNARAAGVKAAAEKTGYKHVGDYYSTTDRMFRTTYEVEEVDDGLDIL